MVGMSIFLSGMNELLSMIMCGLRVVVSCVIL